MGGGPDSKPFITTPTQLPSVLAHSHGQTPSPLPSPTDPSQSGAYPPQMYLNPTYLPPLSDQQQSQSSSANHTPIDPSLQPPPPPPPRPTDASNEASTSAHPIIQFDPKDSPPYDDDDDDDDGDDAGVAGRPKKRKSVANLRGAAQSGAKPGDDDTDDKGRRKIQIEYIEEKSKRHITFSKRKAGIMKKAYELSTLTGTQVLLLVVSESGWVYTFTTDKFKPLVKEDEHGNLSQGQKLIAACLEAKESPQQPSYPPTSTASSFEANSAIHGGQIALKTNNRPPGGRPVATNRRVSSKGRHHIPTAINTGVGHPNMPPPLPTPLSGYLDPALGGMGGPGGPPQMGGPGAQGLTSPMSPRGRSRSGGPPPPVSPGHPRHGGMPPMQQGGDYAEMLQRAEVMQMHHDHGYGGGPSPYDVYSSPPSSQGSHQMSIHAMHDNQHPGMRQPYMSHLQSQPHQQQPLYGGQNDYQNDPYGQIMIPGQGTGFINPQDQGDR
ncbi:SRF-TF-domain-containing protein [Meredithblackwellia eburnea MCA 4105]